MRIVVLIIGLVVVVAGTISLIVTGFAVPQSSEIDVQSFAIQPGQKLTVRSANGRVIYEPWDGEEVKIEARKEVSGLTSSWSKRIGQRVSVEFSQDAQGVQAITRQAPGSWFFGNVRVNFHVWVPREWSGNASISSSNGRITILGHSGNLQVRTSNGSIELSDIQGSLEAVTSNGPIRVTGGTLERDGRLQTSNGSIHLRAHLRPGTSVDVKTSNGPVQLTLVDPDVAVDLSTSNGRIDLQTDVTVSEIDRRHVVGRIGDGLARLNVRTSNGSISLRSE